MVSKKRAKAEQNFARRQLSQVGISKQRAELGRGIEELLECLKPSPHQEQNKEQLLEKTDALIDLLEKIKETSDSNEEASQQLLQRLAKTLVPEGIVEIEVNSIDPSPQPRQTFERESLEILARGLEKEGLQTPIILIPKEGGRYQIFDGERRWRTFKDILRRPTIKALIIPDLGGNIYRRILVTNLHREDLNQLDKAEALIEEIRAKCKDLKTERVISSLRTALRRLERSQSISRIKELIKLSEIQQRQALAELNLDETERQIIGVLIGLQLNPQSILRNTFSALQLSEELKQAVRSRGLGVAQAIELKRLSPEKLDKLSEEKALQVIAEVQEQTISDKLSVRETRELIKWTLSQYSQEDNETNKLVNRWLKNLDNISLDKLERSQLEKLRSALQEKLESVNSALKPASN